MAAPFDGCAVSGLEPPFRFGLLGAPDDIAVDRLADLVELACKTARLGIFERDLISGLGMWSPELFVIRGVEDLGRAPSFEEAARNVLESDRPQFDAAMRGSLLPRGAPVRRQTFALRYRVHAPDGSVRHLHKQWVVRYGADGQAQHLLGVVADETPVETLVAARGVAKTQIEMAAELTGMAFWHQDVATGEVHLNAQAKRLFDIDPGAGSITERRMRMGLDVEDRVAAAAADAKAIASRRPVDIELRHRTAAGGWRVLLTRRGAWVDAQGTVVSLVGVAIDATVAGGARDDAAAAQADFEARNRLLARVSHELRTPMNAILGFAQLLTYDESAHADVPPARLRAVRHIIDAGRHLMALIDDVLDLSRLQGGEMTLQMRAVDLQQVFTSAESLLQAALQERRIVLTLQGLQARVLADETRLRQVALNLLGNSIKYGRPDGRVTVTAVRDADRVRVRVADDGPGMTPAQIVHLFEPFNRLGVETTGAQGTGLGLSISKALVERMGGQVGVESSPMQGTVVEVTLLAAAQEAIPDAAGTPPVLRRRQHNAASSPGPRR